MTLPKKSFLSGREDPDDMTSEIYNDEVRPWVTGNPMPIAGVLIQETREVLNFVEAVERKLMKWGFARSLQG